MAWWSVNWTKVVNFSSFRLHFTTVLFSLLAATSVSLGEDCSIKTLTDIQCKSLGPPLTFLFQQGSWGYMYLFLSYVCILYENTIKVQEICVQPGWYQYLVWPPFAQRTAWILLDYPKVSSSNCLVCYTKLPSELPGALLWTWAVFCAVLCQGDPILLQ